MRDPLPRITDLISEALEGGSAESEDRQRLKDIALRNGEVDREQRVRRQVNPWLAFSEALDAVGPAVNAYIAAEGR